MAEVAVKEGSPEIKGSLRTCTFASAQGMQGLLQLTGKDLSAPDQQILMRLLVFKD